MDKNIKFRFTLYAVAGFFTLVFFTNFGVSQEKQAPKIKMTVNKGVIKPMSIALPAFIKEEGANTIISRELSKVISNNLNGTGLFKTIAQTAHTPCFEQVYPCSCLSASQSPSRDSQSLKQSQTTCLCRRQERAKPMLSTSSSSMATGPSSRTRGLVRPPRFTRRTAPTS